METEIDLATVSFTQSTIKDTFNDGRKVGDLVAKLKAKQLLPKDLPAISVFKDETGKLWTLDNRRLFALKQAFNGKLKVRVIVHDASDADRLAEFERKFTTSTQGNGIRVKDGLPTRFPRRGRNGAFYVYTKDNKKRYWCQLSKSEKEEIKKLAAQNQPGKDEWSAAIEAAETDAKAKDANATERTADAEKNEPRDDVDREVARGCADAQDPTMQKHRRMLGRILAEKREVEQSLARSDRAVGDLKKSIAADRARLEAIAEDSARASARRRNEEFRMAEQAQALAAQRREAEQRADQQRRAAAELVMRRQLHQRRQPQHDPASWGYDRRGPASFVDVWTPSSSFRPHVFQHAPSSTPGHSSHPVHPLATHGPSPGRAYHGNTWNDFQQANGGRGWTKAQMSSEWKDYKASK